jgi:hypothetical protein
MTTTPDRPRVLDDIPEQRGTSREAPVRPPGFPRVVTGLSHGGHVLADDVPTVDPDRDPARGMRWAEVEQASTPFGYMFPGLQGRYPGAHLPVEPAAAVVASLKALGTAMIDQRSDPADADSGVPPIYTYWGQFVDHDLTANTDRDEDISITDLPLQPLQPEQVLRKLRNLREPRLNLDSVYGNGPRHSGEKDQVPYDGDRLVVEEDLSPFPFADQVAVPGADLPRAEQKAQIGDGRNDENLVVAQLHLAFLRFHNEVLAWLDAHPDAEVPGDGRFARARQLVEWHYQWVTVQDFLRTIARPEDVDGLLDGTVAPVFELQADTRPEDVFMPLEFSVAAYRFGHSMIRAAYDWNENFGAPGDRNPSAPFEFLFLFTGNGGLAGQPTLPGNWPARFERLTGAAPHAAQPRADGSPDPVPPRFARKIDTRIAPPLAALANEGEEDGVPDRSDRIRRILKRLAVRNLLRAYRLGIPTGQAIARELGTPPLTREDLLVFPDPRSTEASPVDDALVDGGFLEDTPLWFYVLREAEVREQGERLGPVGSRIVTETIIGQLRADPTSFLNRGWDPSKGVTTDGGQPVEDIVTFLRFAGVHP